ncbi:MULTISPECIES: gluconate 2-dehydrogenase subunit 3 family protein [unclassified Mucilaginibacter]|uniref:gluconate 2-dehydrogenase subunit 3 family protein n=1 Tax=unclassified Mucilaginibacter TaxID=2617802 RepID=UPI002AC9E269|nr:MULTISPECIES: gluconate 2-dehydrogenase subunit 3 family protein [unclassified Mucilaginibacter]MEB0262731.1 gluconate 2-dehydrogenase subunit 3 family protein [Mucilaginibacter sp. 10I4]MEB0279502.1 gluconate 2-dehydrogenase subunit 3 family protein [Mucilaginibacter sp. 10B2]MEB0302800.1 gluconate 2-dehydrogenase subunit 3 family protein [Mucilaginibacter sp. 5C4]WPX22630.1 gluconate 2-dehydrogenase subunit 3 family protein [Mucilaginibacter sp. 5C4]
MNRRIAIRNMALILGSAAILPSCLTDKGKPVVQLKKLKVDADQEKVVNNLAETILPKTDTPGAAELGINLFVFKMIDDCYDKEHQADFIKGLGDFADAAKKQLGKSFNEATVAERTAFVNTVDKNAKDEKYKDVTKLTAFYKMVKDQTVFGYTTSKYFMTKQIVYELVPGRYNAYFPVKKLAVV